jgi:hypothetical protein
MLSNTAVSRNCNSGECIAEPMNKIAWTGLVLSVAFVLNCPGAARAGSCGAEIARLENCDESGASQSADRAKRPGNGRCAASSSADS